MSDKTPKVNHGNNWFSHPLVKISLLVFLTLICLIPVMFFTSLREDRQGLRDQGWDKITAGWGGRQAVPGPYLRIPYIEYFEEEDKVYSREKYLIVFPQVMDLEGRIAAERKELGIFRYPLYVFDGTFTGDFAIDRSKDFGVENIQWQDSTLVWELEGASSLAGWPSLNWRGKDYSWEKGTGNLGLSQKALFYPVGNATDGSYTISFSIKGAERLSFYPLGRSNTTALEGTWSSPGFFGSALPNRSRLGEEDFSALWNILGLARSLPDSFALDDAQTIGLQADIYGVNLFEPVNHYHQMERATKYAILFVVLPFLVLFLWEVLSRRKIHFLQYGLIGVANTLFFLLLLAFSEHWNFLLAFGLAALLPTALVTFYVGALMGWSLRTAILPGVMGFAYAFLYMVLQSEDYALLWGSLGVFLMVAAVMVLTRKLDWDNLGQISPSAQSAQSAGTSAGSSGDGHGG
jgi:inner membrane protein